MATTARSPTPSLSPAANPKETENVNSLLYMRGIDAAIINSDLLDEYKNQVPDIQRKIAYVPNLFPSELHVFVRPEIQSPCRSCRQEGEFQYAWHRGGLTADLLSFGSRR